MYQVKDIIYYGGTYTTRDKNYFICRPDREGYSYWYESSTFIMLGNKSYDYLFVLPNNNEENIQVWVDKLNKILL